MPLLQRALCHTREFATSSNAALLLSTMAFDGRWVPPSTPAHRTDAISDEAICNRLESLAFQPFRHDPATGLRRSELPALRWSDFNADARTVTVTGKLVRVTGNGLVRVDDTKTAAGRRTLPLPRFAVDMLRARRPVPYLGEHPVIFPSTAGTLRDPNNFGKQWRTVRKDLGVPAVTTHSFRKTVATLIDDEGLSARIGAHHLGHTHVSMTQGRYMSRGRDHTQVAELLDRTIKSDE
jgi:integrase